MVRVAVVSFFMRNHSELVIMIRIVKKAGAVATFVYCGESTVKVIF